jgi:membrane carboxypeptidase/penicillin-binding protein
MEREISFATKIANNKAKTTNPITATKALAITVTKTTMLQKLDTRMLTLAVTLALTLATTAVIGAFVQPVEAASSTQFKETIRTNSQSAYSQWVENLDDGTNVYTTIVSSLQDKNVEVFYGKAILYPDGSSYREEGNMVTTDSKVLSIDNQLDHASLSTVEVPVRFACNLNAATGVEECFDPMKTVQVQASWVGEGEISDVAYETKDKTDAFKIKYTDLQSFRSATATGSVDDESLGNSIIAFMATAKLVSITHYR